MTEKRRLGRGLDALLGGAAAIERVDEPADGDGKPPAGAVGQVPVDQIQLNPHQPRKDFDPDELAALQQSLEVHGLLQPIVVRPTDEGYQLVAGERRLRAAKECGWKEIPVHVVDMNDQKQFAAALVENLQRTDLNPIEKAQGFREYMQMYGVTHEQCAQQMGLDRSTITNLVRLLDLPAEVQEAVRLGQISNGHARALLSLEAAGRQVSVCKEIIAKGLSVRAIEALTRDEAPAEPEKSARPTVHKTRHIQSLEDELKQLLATKVEIRLKAKHRGQFVIDFESNDDFERIIAQLRR